MRVNCVCPGPVTTTRIMVVPKAARDSYTEKTALKRFGTDDEVGGFLAYLATPAASWIQGQSINVDGGFIMEH